MPPCPRRDASPSFTGLMKCPTARSYAFALTIALAGALGYFFVAGRTSDKVAVVRERSEEEEDDDDESKKSKVVFVLGGPGSGKGTQCEKLTQSFASIMHLSAGDLLRAERKKIGSKLADIINDKINKGELVPSEITVQLIQNAMKELRETKRCCKFLIDGFPRSQENLDAWDKVMDASEVKVEFVLYLDCPESVMTERLVQRGKTSGRSDDNEEIIKKRFQTAQKEMMPIVEAYKKEGTLKTVSADQSIENVFAEASKLFEDF